MTPDIILQRTGIDVRAVEQGDDAWHKLRLGVITASEVHNVIAKPRSGKKWPDMKMSYFHTLLGTLITFRIVLRLRAGRVTTSRSPVKRKRQNWQ
ncbi:exonuclease, partial [Escherichia coli HVH 145 (4-5672112)]